MRCYKDDCRLYVYYNKKTYDFWGTQGLGITILEFKEDICFYQEQDGPPSQRPLYKVEGKLKQLKLGDVFNV